jgi:hypothetical protein
MCQVRNRLLKKLHLLRCAQSARSNVPAKSASARRFFARLTSEIFLSSLQPEFFGDLPIAPRSRHHSIFAFKQLLSVYKIVNLCPSLYTKRRALDLWTTPWMASFKHAEAPVTVRGLDDCALGFRAAIKLDELVAFSYAVRLVVLPFTAGGS